MTAVFQRRPDRNGGGSAYNESDGAGTGTGKVNLVATLPPRPAQTPRRGDGYVGSRRHRVSMVCPKSLSELQARAERLFGGDGCLRMYHHGKVLIKEPSDFAEVRDGDVVVVTWDDRQLSTGEFAHLVSTMKKDYTKKPLPGASLSGSVKPMQPALRFDADSSHRIDFADPGLCTRREIWWKPGYRTVGPSPHVADTRTTYSDEYDRKDCQGSRPLPPPGPAINLMQGAMPFKDETSYRREFGRTPRQVPNPMNAPISTCRLNGDGPKEFVGDTTYKVDYPGYGSEYARPRSSSKPSRPKLPSKHLETDTEYRHRYNGNADKPCVIHVEPFRTPRPRH